MNDYSKYDPFSENYDPTLKQEVITITVCKDCQEINDGWIAEKVTSMLNGRKLLCLVIHGSKLYGLDHDKSDLDIKGVFMPSKSDMYLGRIDKTLNFKTGTDESKNSMDDVDIELYSLQHFVKLASDGDTGAMSMLYVPFEQICCQHEIWSTRIVPSRDLFLCKDMAGLIGYVRTQTSKYCNKGDRLMAVNIANDFLSYHSDETKLREIWEYVPETDATDYMKKIELNGQVFWEVCNRKIQDASTVKYAKGVIFSIINSYGKRAKQAHDNDGLNWKAISHAFRVASELSDLFEFGMMKYPLEDFERIKRIKMGELDFATEVLPDLNSLMDRVHKKAQESNFPESIDKGKIDNLLYELITILLNDGGN